MKTSYLDTVYRKTGILSNEWCSHFHREAMCQMMDLDNAWIATHQFLNDCVFDSKVVRPSHPKLTTDWIMEALAVLDKEICTRRNLIDTVIRIADNYMENELPVEDMKKPLYLVEALEATLWRAYEALKASQILADRGLQASCYLELRAGQEAILLHKRFARKPTDAKLARVNGVLKQAREIAFANEFNETQFNERSVSLDDTLEEHIQELGKSGVTVRRLSNGKLDPPKGKVFLEDNCLEKKTDWWDLVDDQILKEVYGEKQRRHYVDIFTGGNASAHSLSPLWHHYIHSLNGPLERIASVSPSPYELPIFYATTIKDFMNILISRRPAVNPIYEDWINICTNTALEFEPS